MILLRVVRSVTWNMRGNGRSQWLILWNGGRGAQAVAAWIIDNLLTCRLLRCCCWCLFFFYLLCVIFPVASARTVLFLFLWCFSFVLAVEKCSLRCTYCDNAASVTLYWNNDMPFDICLIQHRTDLLHLWRRSVHTASYLHRQCPSFTLTFNFLICPSLILLIIFRLLPFIQIQLFFLCLFFICSPITRISPT